MASRLFLAIYLLQQWFPTFVNTVVLGLQLSETAGCEGCCGPRTLESHKVGNHRWVYPGKIHFWIPLKQENMKVTEYSAEKKKII